MRTLIAFVLALVVLGGCTNTAPTVAPTATPVGTVPPSADFVSGGELVVGPPEAEGRSCGLVRDYKIGGRVNPPAQQADGTWRVSGCFYSHGNELWQTQVVLLFNDGTEADAQRLVVVPVRHFVPKDHQEVPFGTTLRPTAGLSRLRAFLVAYVR